MDEQKETKILKNQRGDSPLTVRVTSLSATPIRGTMALQVYVPASSCVTAFSCRVLLLLSTLKEERGEERQRGPRRTAREPQRIVKEPQGTVREPQRTARRWAKGGR